ncbi:helix-turn-helix transcriptional regulator [Brevibacterium yomogidense]|uniref:helix-turn-helix transcriptional regulator n=1 Tax=Brevibacterium yomogidense TaxID=946573 RepID=UPI0018DF8B33|nr:helix-turn-helix transcriptional regulator [Brevibacterium yomogidense]
MTGQSPPGAGGVSGLTGTAAAMGPTGRPRDTAGNGEAASATGSDRPGVGRSTVARTAAGLLTTEGSGVLVVPGLWGAETAVTAAEAVAGCAPVLTVTGGAGGGGHLGDLVAALHESDPAIDSADTALAAWRALGARGAVVIVRSAAGLDTATGEAVAQAAVVGTHRALVVAGHFDDLCEPLARRVSEGRLRWSRVEQLAPTVLARVLAEQCGDAVPSVVLGRIHALSGGHPALVDLVIDAAEDTGVLTFEADGPVWRWDEDALRRGLADEFPGLLDGFDGVHASIVTCTGLGYVLRTSHLAQQFAPRTIASLRDTGILVPYPGPYPRTALVQLGATVLAWAVQETVSLGEDVAAWYDFGSAGGAATGGGLARIALGAWRLRVERTIAPAEAARLAEGALAHGWHETAAALLDAVPAAPSRGHPDDAGVRLTVAMLRARAAWAHGDADGALRILEEKRSELWPAEGPTPRAGKHAALLTLHLASFHRVRAFEVLGGAQWAGSLRTIVEHGLVTARRAGLSLLPDVIVALMDDDEDLALALVQRQGLSVDFVEEAIARLWVGGAAGLRSAHDVGRQVLSSLLDDLEREGGLPNLVESTRAILLIITMFVGWRADDLRVNAREWNLGRLWHPGAHTVDQLIRSVVSMQDDRMATSMRAALSAEDAAADRDAYGMRAVALSMIAGAGSYLRDERAREHEDAARSALAGLDTADLFPHLRYFAEGMALVGSGPPTSEVSAQIVAVAHRAAVYGETAQHQQLLLLAILGGDEQAIHEGLMLGTTIGSGRAGMIRMLAEALAAGAGDSDGGRDGAGGSEQADPLDTADAFVTARTRYLAHTVLAARWARETAGGAAASHRLIRMLLRVNGESTEYSWLLDTTAPELRLSDRETVLVKCLHDGEATGTIASRLGLSPRTVEGIISRLLTRFGVANRLELVRLVGEFADPTAPKTTTRS